VQSDWGERVIRDMWVRLKVRLVEEERRRRRRRRRREGVIYNILFI